MTYFLALALACGEAASPSAAGATRDAASGQVGALSRCLELPSAASGACVVAGLNAAPLGEVKAACVRLPEGNARGECWFAVAERLQDEAPTRRPVDLDAVVDACAQARPFEVDCARHAWQTVRIGHPADEGALLSRLRVALPRHAGEFARDAAWISEQGARADAERAANERAAALRLEILRSRWTRRAHAEAAVKTQLCAGTIDDVARRTQQDPLFSRLVWERAPATDATVLEARREVCGQRAPSDP